MACSNQEELLGSVKDYYGKVLKTSEDLLTTACKTPSTKLPKHVRDALSLVHDEVASKYYGCGIVAPSRLEGASIVDLGSGSGRDCYALSKLVGAQGKVLGIDMTDEQLEVANKYIDYHADKFGFGNVEFKKGYIEKLADVGIADNSVDVVISNCVVNLCEDKRQVLEEVYRVLKPGGELYFSDVYCDRKLDESIRKHQVLWNECVSGALHWKELNEISAQVGFETPRIYTAHAFDITKEELKKVVGDAEFVSVTYRLFKLDKSKCETEDKQIIYDGQILGCEDELKFDYKLSFTAQKPVTVEKDTYNLIKQSRFSPHFEARKAPCCAKPQKVVAEDPFEIVANGGDEMKAPSGGCC